MNDRIDLKLGSLVRELVDASPPPPALPPPPSRRSARWLRPAALAMALVVVGAGVALLVVSRGHQATVSIGTARGADSYLVLDNGPSTATLVDVATGASRTVTFPGKGGGDAPYQLFVTGGRFVYPAVQGVSAVPTSFNEPPRVLGQARYDIPSSTPGRIWLIIPNDNGVGVPVRAQEVSVDGHYRGPVYQLPGTSPGAIAAVNGGLVVVDQNQSFVWYPATNHTGPSVPGSGSFLVDARGALLAWGLDCSPFDVCASVQVFDLANARSRIYPAPPGTAGWIATGGGGSRDALSPNGGSLALRAALTPGIPNRTFASRLYLLERTTGAATLVPHSQAQAYSPAAWSPDGKQVFFENDAGTIGIYHPADNRSRTLPTPWRGTAFLTIPK